MTPIKPHITPSAATLLLTCVLCAADALARPSLEAVAVFTASLTALLSITVDAPAHPVHVRRPPMTALLTNPLFVIFLLGVIAGVILMGLLTRTRRPY